jgi:hypothetical protein
VMPSMATRELRFVERDRPTVIISLRRQILRRLV